MESHLLYISRTYYIKNAVELRNYEEPSRGTLHGDANDISW
jgi:hypothetical protein